jgi:hypothetical protein
LIAQLLPCRLGTKLEQRHGPRLAVAPILAMVCSFTPWKHSVVAVLTLAAAIAIHFDRSAARSAVIALYVATLLAAGGLLLTGKAAPIMLGIPDLIEPSSLQRAFAGFWYWGNLRTACQILVFAAQAVSCGILLNAKS